MATAALKRTPLYDRHPAAGAKLVPFAGWEMPVEYEGIRPEHMAVRTHAGIFDVSHMGEVETEGPEAVAFLQRVLSNDVSKIEIGGAQYSCLSNEEGGVIDDLFTYRLARDRYLTVTNAANHGTDLAGWRATPRVRRVLRDVADSYSMLAVQGPNARRIVAETAEARAAGADARRRRCRRRPGTGLRHRLHRRGRGRAVDRPRARAGRSGPLLATRASSPAASGHATRCASRSAFTSTART